MKTPTPFSATHLLVASLAVACGSDKPEGSTTEDSGVETPDLTERLESGETRAGVVTDEAALIGGISSEGKAGDFKIYNAAVSFIIQAPGESNYYVGYGGSIIDADVVRPEGTMGQDVIDDASMMVGLGRMFSAETVEVINDGSDGNAAIVRSTGGVEPLRLLTGTVEAPGLIPERDLSIVTDYILEPNSHLLRLESTINWMDVPTPIQLAEFMFMAADITATYQHTAGYAETDPLTYGYNAIVGRRHEIAVAVLQGEEDGVFATNSVLEALGDIGPLLLGSIPMQTLSDGDVVHWTRYIGVGNDLSSITDDWHDRRSETTETLGGTVTAGGAPVAGARVHFMDGDGQPLTFAQTDAEGHYSATLPVGQAATVLAESRGPAVYFDRAPGSGWLGPYNAASVAAAAIESLSGSATPIPFSPGHGFSSEAPASTETALTLTVPATLSVSIDGGGSAMVRVALTADDSASNSAVVPGRPAGQFAYLYIRDGEASIPVEPGDYVVIVSRGPTHEAHTEEVSLTSGETTSLSVSLEESVDTNGLWSLDPHSHAAPSGDGSISMEGRLTVHAAHDVDVHFGTDHDNVADYRPLLAPLGLDDRLVSIVADEVSPTMRGHHNAYPLEVVPDAPNNGAFLWWRDIHEWLDTDGLHAGIRGMHSDGDVIVQANHPTGNSGLFDSANYTLSTGRIGSPDYWGESFEAFELLNDGNYGTVFPYYLDLLNRGLEPTPVGVSDSHSHLGGAGENRTWVPLDVPDVASFTNDDVRTAIRTAGTIISRGPLFLPTIDGEWAPGSTHTGAVEVDVEVRTPSWIEVNTLHVFENGVETQTVAIDGSATVSLEPEADSVYVLTITGDEPMAPVYPGRTPWAAAQAFFVDVDGDGWTPPLPPLNLD
jgi:hypothetical protein